MQKGANVDTASKDGVTALHWAAIMNHYEVCQLLISKGASTDLVDSNNRYFDCIFITSLHYEENVILKNRLTKLSSKS